MHLQSKSNDFLGGNIFNNLAFFIILLINILIKLEKTEVLKTSVLFIHFY